MSGSLTIEIETGNATFADGNEAAELARILRDAARRIENGHTWIQAARLQREPCGLLRV